MPQKQQFSQKEKFQIASKYASGHYTQDQLAIAHFTSRATIQRILKEMGRKYKDSKRITVSPEESQVLDLVRERGITPRTLEDLMKPRPVSAKAVQAFLTNLPSEDFDNFTSAVGYSRMQRKLREHQAANTAAGDPSKEAANG